MDTMLSITLLILGASSTVAAFGGKTWIEGEKSLIERITPRGWVSIVCLMLALVIGITKELHTREVDLASALSNKLATEEAKAQADKRQSDTQNELTITQGQLAVANAKLSDLGKLVQFTQDQITGGNGFPVALILWDYLRTNRGEAPDAKHELTFVEDINPIKSLVEEITGSGKESSMAFSGGVSLKQLFNLAREESVEYIKSVSY